jgi:hypothetical protein
MPPPPAPAERFATLLRWLGQAVAARSGGDRLSYALIGLIIDRIRGINQCFARLAARIRDGKYFSRRFAPRRPPVGDRHREPNKLPQTFGWLLKLVPEAVGSRSQLECLLRDPEFAALLAAAPASLGRPLRSLCRMLRVSPPEILAPPARPRPPRKTPPAPKTPPPPPRPQPPAWLRMPPSRTRWTLARSCGPPHRA